MPPTHQLTLTTLLSLSLFVLFQWLQDTRIIHKKPVDLKRGFIIARLDVALRLMAANLSLLTPFYFLMIEYVTLLDLIVPLVIFPVIISLIVNPELAIDSSANLVITKPLVGKGVTLHLRQPYQDFDRQTYKELLHLVEELPKYQVKVIKLSSPMFYDKRGKIRSFDTLEKGLNKRNAFFVHSSAGRFSCLVGKISMLLSSDKRKKEKIHNISLSKWHEIKIIL